MPEDNEVSIENGKYTIEEDGRKITFKIHDLGVKSPSFRRDMELIKREAPQVGIGIITDTDFVVWSLDCNTHRTLRKAANIQQINIVGRFQISSDEGEDLTLHLLTSEHGDIRTIVNFLKKSRIYSGIELDIDRVHTPRLNDEIMSTLVMNPINVESVFKGKLTNFNLDV